MWPKDNILEHCHVSQHSLTKVETYTIIGKLSQRGVLQLAKPSGDPSISRKRNAPARERLFPQGILDTNAIKNYSRDRNSFLEMRRSGGVLERDSQRTVS